MPRIKHIQTGNIIDVSAIPEWESGIWECGSQRFTDLEKTDYEPVTSKTISSIKIKLLLTAQERISLKQASITDPLIADFFYVIDDPRTPDDYIDDSMAQIWLDRMTDQSLLSDTRKTEILSVIQG